MRIKNYARLFLIFFLLCSGGCGGGTSGSGLKNYHGSIDDTSSRALPGVNVTIESTGDNTTTDTDGKFAFQSSAFGKDISFLIESTDFKSRVVLQEIPESSAHISLKIVVDTRTDVAVVNQLNVRAGFVGLCDNYFENTETIRQANQVPDGTVCTLSAIVRGDGQLLNNIPVALEYSGCNETSAWETIAVALTGLEEENGEGKVKFSFPYHDSSTYCRYRIVAPSDSSIHVPVYFPIVTFTEQRIHPHIPSSEQTGRD